MATFRDVYLYGHLADKFGAKHTFAVDNPAEALRALCVTKRGFKEALREGDYRVTRGKRDLNLEQLQLGFGRIKDLHVVPVTASAGVEALIIGGLLLLGAVALTVALIPQIEAPSADDREDDDKKSAIYNGPVNVTEQGHCVPVVYGQVLVGSVVGSASLETVDVPFAGLPSGELSTPGFIDSTYGNDLYYNKGGKGGGSSSRVAQEDPNTLQSNATARVLDILCEGEIVGLLDGLKSVYLDDTPIQNPDGSFNFKGVAFDMRPGTPSQDFIPGFSAVENTIEVDTPVTYLSPVPVTLTDDEINRVKVTIQVDALSKQNQETGDLTSAVVNAQVEVSFNGGEWFDWTQYNFSGKCTSPYQKSFEIVCTPDMFPLGIRVERGQPDSDTVTVRDTIRFASYTTIKDVRLTYPDTAVAGLIIDAMQFGSSIPTRGYLIKGRIVEVPANFDPIARTYATSGPGTSGGSWDGTFKQAWTDDPPWCFRDLLLNKRFGLGKRLGVSTVDKWALLAISERCIEQISNGQGGTSPRHTLNVCLDKAGKALEVLQSMAASFRSMVYWGSGTVHLVQDSPPDEIAKIVTPSNVEDGYIDYPGPSLEDKYSAVIVYWNDPEDSYRLQPEVVEDDVLRAIIGWKPKELGVMGINNRAEAARHGRWFLDDQRYGSGQIKYGAGMDHADLTPGSVVSIADPEFTTTRRGGRVKTAVTTTITLDAAVTLASGRTYTLMCMLPDGSVEEKAVTNSLPVTTAVVTINTAYSLTPIAGAVWALKDDQVAPRQMRTLTVTERDDELGFNILGTTHDPNRYARVEEDLKLEPVPYSNLPSGGLAAPTGLTVQTFLKNVGGFPQQYLTFGWTAPSDARVQNFQAQVRRPDTENYDRFPSSPVTSVEVPNTVAGGYTLRVRSLDALGRPSPWVAVEYQLADALNEFLATTPTGWTAELVILSADLGSMAAIAIAGNNTTTLPSTTVIEYRPVGTDTWFSYGDHPSGQVTINLTDIIPGEIYEVSVSYRLVGFSFTTPRQIIGPVDTSSLRPAAPIKISAYHDADQVKLIWDVVQSPLAIEYEVRYGGQGWDTSLPLPRTTSTSLYAPGSLNNVADVFYFVKARTVQGGAYSLLAAGVNLEAAPITGRNVMLIKDFSELNWPGVCHYLDQSGSGASSKLEVGNTDAQLFNDDGEILEADNGSDLVVEQAGVRPPKAHYICDSNIEVGPFISRVWTNVNVSRVLTPLVTLDDLEGVSLDDLASFTVGEEVVPIDDAQVKQYASLDTKPTDTLEGFRLQGNATGSEGQISSAEINVTYDQPVWLSRGVLLDDGLIKWSRSVPSSFAIMFDCKAEIANQSGGLLRLDTSDGDTLVLDYDYDTDELVLHDSNSLELRLQAPNWTFRNPYRIQISQTGSTRTLTYISLYDETVYTVSDEQAPLGGFTSISLGRTAGFLDDLEGTTLDDLDGVTLDELSTLPGLIMAYADLEIMQSALSTDQLRLRGPAGYTPFFELVPADYNFRKIVLWVELSVLGGTGDRISLNETVLYVDVPDLIERGNDVIPAEGLRIPFLRGFYATPQFLADWESGFYSDIRIEKSNLDKTGVDVVCVNLVTNEPVEAEIRWASIGYGR